MSTRASIKFSDNQGNFIANVYHHYDGYPEYLGAKLLKLTKPAIVNGLRLRADRSLPLLGETFNGMGCLVASVIAILKDCPGSVALYTEDDFGECHEDYLYEVIENSEGNGVEVFVMNMEGEWEFVSDVLAGVENFYTSRIV